MVGTGAISAVAVVSGVGSRSSVAIRRRVSSGQRPLGEVGAAGGDAYSGPWGRPCIDGVVFPVGHPPDFPDGNPYSVVDEAIPARDDGVRR